MDFLDELLFKAIAFLIAITVHSFAQAYVAYRFGDPTPKLAGRITLNPIPHMDFLGTFLIIFFPIGWAKPVHFDPLQFGRRKRIGMIMTKLAGPLANLATAVVFAVFWVILMSSGLISEGGLNTEVWREFIQQVVSSVVFLNLLLFLFYLVPIPPMDGYWVVRELLPLKTRYKMQGFEKFGPFILLLAIWFGLINFLLLPPVHMLMSLINSFVKVG